MSSLMLKCLSSLCITFANVPLIKASQMTITHVAAEATEGHWFKKARTNQGTLLQKHTKPLLNKQYFMLLLVWSFLSKHFQLFFSLILPPKYSTGKHPNSDQIQQSAYSALYWSNCILPKKIIQTYWLLSIVIHNYKSHLGIEYYLSTNFSG